MRFPSTLLLAVCTVAAGCVDAKSAFDDFGSRVIDAAPPVDSAIVTSIPDIGGEWFMTAKLPFDQPTYVYFTGTYVFHPVSENTARIDWTGYALDLDTFEPVGEPFVANDVDVGTDGIADVPLIGTLEGEANPVTGGDADADAVVHATLVAEDFVCGNLTGPAGGLQLDGTTFAAVRITGATLPDPVWRCEDQPTQ